MGRGQRWEADHKPCSKKKKRLQILGGKEAGKDAGLSVGNSEGAGSGFASALKMRMLKEG